jgi:hypothetical protein
MAVVNRCAISLAPRQPLIDWSRRISDEAELIWGAEDHSLYLIPPYENPAEAQAWLETHYDWIFANELESWCRDASLWPDPRSYSLFRDWFAVRFYDLVDDLSDGDLKREDGD